MNLRIGGRNIEHFNDFNFTLNYNTLASTFDFRANFDPNNSEHRILFKPGSFNKVEIEHNGELLITGVLVNHDFSVKNTIDLASFSGYSLPGVLGDCNIGLDQYPLEFNNLSLKEITEQLINPFGLGLSIDASAEEEANLLYEEVTAEGQKTIKQLLSDLAFERGLILTHDNKGNLVITKTNLNRPPVVNYVEGSVGINEITLGVAGQGMHSRIYVQQETDVDEASNAAESFIDNPLVSAFRPKVVRQSSGDDNDTEKFNRSEIGAELRNINVRVRVYRWEWNNAGNTEIIRPNNIISILSPHNFIFKQTNFFVESVTFIGNQKEQVADIVCVPIDVYSADIVLNRIKNLFNG